MARRELRDDQWNKIKGLLPGKKNDPGRTAKNNRRFVDALLWIARTGAHWRELPKEFGPWNSIFPRYIVVPKIIESLSTPPQGGVWLRETPL